MVVLIALSLNLTLIVTYLVLHGSLKRILNTSMEVQVGKPFFVYQILTCIL